MFCFNRISLIIVLVFQALVLISCGNIINDDILSREDNSSIIDADGDAGIFFTELSRDFSTSGDIRIEKSGNDGYYLAGTVVEETSENIWFSLIGKNGKLISEALLRSGCNDRVRRVKVLDNENLIIYADRYYGDGDIDFIIAKVNRNTGIVWDYCFGDEAKNRVFDVISTDDGGAVLTGLSYYQLLGIMRYITFIMKIDSSGRIVWKKDYRSLFSIFMPSEINDTGNGEYLVSGLCLNRITNKFKTFFTKVDNNGDVISSKYINAAGLHSMLIGTSLVDNNGFTGIISLTGGSYADSLVVINFDNMMNIQAVREYSFPDFNVRGKYIRGTDGGVIIAGMLNNEAGNGLYFIMLSKLGVIQNLTTKHYNADEYDLSDVYFNTAESDDGVLYLCRYNNSSGSFPDGRLFLDRVQRDKSYKLISSKAGRDVNADATDYETGGVDLETGDSSLMEKGKAYLSFDVH